MYENKFINVIVNKLKSGFFSIVKREEAGI